jgi:hypothetical protein
LLQPRQGGFEALHFVAGHEAGTAQFFLGQRPSQRGTIPAPGQQSPGSLLEHAQSSMKINIRPWLTESFQLVMKSQGIMA